MSPLTRFEAGSTVSQRGVIGFGTTTLRYCAATSEAVLSATPLNASSGFFAGGFVGPARQYGGTLPPDSGCLSVWDAELGSGRS